MTRDLWVRADRPDSAEERKELVITALEAGIVTAIVRPEDSDFSGLGKIDLVFNDDGELSGDVRMMTVSSPEEQEEAMSVAGRSGTLIIDTGDWKVIPLENMIAAFSGTKTKVMACASDTEQAELLAGILEKGVDGIVIDAADPNAIRGIAGSLSGAGRTDLSVLTVENVADIGMGDRVCVDTVSMMVPGEGMLVGSQASCLFLVQSESEDNGYVAARPFRVNAGAVHAYVMTPGGRTRYLSELRSGEPLVLTDSEGSNRQSAVGRCKIERRPLLVVTASLDGETYTTILQNAETVKMVGPDGAMSVTSLKSGDKVYAKVEEGGRHFGMKIDETIREV